MTISDNSKQEWHAESYEKDTGFVSEYGEDVLGWLGPIDGRSVLDLGCGDGRLTEKLSQMGANVTGLDASENFVDAAKNRGLDVQLGNGHELNFNHQFDAVFSNAALHWMVQPKKVLVGVNRAVKPGGRFVGEFGGFGNVAAVTTAIRAIGKSRGGDIGLLGPWFFPTVEQYQQLLQEHGFRVDRITSFYRPTPVPNGIKAWLQVMCAPFFDQFNDQKEEIYEQVISALEPSLRDNNGLWHADYVRLRFSATKLKGVGDNDYSQQ